MQSKNIFRIVGTLVGLSLDAGSIIAMIMEHEFLQGFNLGVPGYAAIIIFCTGMIVYLNWIWIASRLPIYRFQKLECQIYELTNLSEKISNTTSADLIYLQSELSSLKIPSPVISDVYGWSSFLPILYTLCKRKQLKKARALWPDLYAHLKND